MEKFSKPREAFYSLHDFQNAISGVDFARLIDAKIVANPNYLDNIKLFGYTLLDSLRVILRYLHQIIQGSGTTNERAFIFDQVSTGRSPMVVVRVAPIKPRLVVIQNIDNVDKLAIKIAQIEHIPLLTTKLNAEELKLS